MCGYKKCRVTEVQAQGPMLGSVCPAHIPHLLATLALKVFSDRHFNGEHGMGGLVLRGVQVCSISQPCSPSFKTTRPNCTAYVKGIGLHSI